MEKQCTKCGEVKPLDMFGVDVRRVDGCKAQCKACSAKWFMEYKNNGMRDKINDYNRKSASARKDYGKLYIGAIKAAKMAGEAKYNGKLCQKHNSTERWTNSSLCVQCKNESSRDYSRRKAAERRETATTPK